MDREEWLAEQSDLWPGQKFCLQLKKQLFKDKSPYQDVAVYESVAYGNVLVLDGIIQCTERDEASYSEMITHLPLCSLKEAPKKVLVIGGGDGGVVREITRYKSVERIDVAEIDEMVVDVSKKYLPKMGVSFDDPRVQLHIGDGFEFVKNAPAESYDGVIVDSSDPVGPAMVLYKKPFYEAIYRALKPGGAACSMAECMWLHLDFMEGIVATWASVFAGGSVSYGYTCTPTYPCGQIGLLVCMKQDGNKRPVNPQEPPQLHYKNGCTTEQPPMQYYNEKIHTAAFAIPEFARVVFEKYLTFQ